MDKKQLLTVRGTVVDTLHDVPEWGTVNLRRLSYASVDKFNRMQAEPTKALAYLVAAGVCDEDGNRLFSDDDVAQIMELPAETVIPVGQAVAKRIGVTFDRLDDAKKNSAPIASSASSTSSPERSA